MIHALLFVAALAATEPDSTTANRRADAALVLRRAFAEAPREVDVERWVAAANAAIAALGPGPVAASLERAVVDARWIALFDARRAAADLERELRTAADDLAFTPLREAELPVGFPAPTPVRDIELKRYPQYRLVRADMQSGGSSSAFWELFQHIKSRDIAMTAPVETTYAAGEDLWDESEMAFLYGSREIGQTGPAGKVEVIDAPSVWALSIGCRGRMTRASLDAARARLQAWIDGQDRLEIAGPVRTMGYNSPMVPAARQFYEVQVPMRWKSESANEKLVVGFDGEGAAALWTPIHDRVMGGLSSGALVATNQGTCVFEGDLSLENNGGFASVRTRPGDYGLAGARTVRLTVRGDGRTYKLRLGTQQASDGVNYELPFTTKSGVWSSHEFAIADFVPVWRGRRVADAGPLLAADVRTVGLMIADKVPGPFRIELAQLVRD